jgi:hypothetical protein
MENYNDKALNDLAKLFNKKKLSVNKRHEAMKILLRFSKKQNEEMHEELQDLRCEVNKFETVKKYLQTTTTRNY